MNTETLTEVIAEAMATAIQPLRQELGGLKSKSISTAQSQEDEPDWEIFDRAARELNFIVKP